MDLFLGAPDLTRYHSGSQLARVRTEAWAAANVYCLECGASRLQREPNNAKVLDFKCPSCSERYQLKSKAGAFGRKLAGAHYDTLLDAIRSSRGPSYVLLSYDATTGAVRDVVAIPRGYIVDSVVERRPPLRVTARRAGWVGANLLLDRVPLDGKVILVQHGVERAKAEVLREWQRSLPLKQQGAKSRGWTVDVLRAVRALGRDRFLLAEVYAHASELARLHPRNQNVHAKIRQQLQVLREMDILKFEGRGRYALTASPVAHG